MKKKIAVLGAGLVGSAIAKDLSNDFEVTSMDYNAEALKAFDAFPNINTKVVDLSKAENIKASIKPYDFVVGALPGFMGFSALKSIIEAGKNVVDISFFPEDPFELNALAIGNNVTAIVDCGVAPGMGNIILGYHDKLMKVHSFKCFVGGLPLIREWPWEYKAVFSPIDVIEEYTRSARYVENGNVITKEALSDAELKHFNQVGTLEAWNSDGLRSLITTMPHIPNMIEKTLRFPGNIEYLKVLRESGFFSYEPVEVNGMPIRPIDLTAKILFPQWKLKEGEGDFTVMKIIIEGVRNGQRETYEYNLYDEFDTEGNIISMARTTGYTCNAALNLLINGSFNRKGICPPEYINDKNCFQQVMDYLKERKVIYNINHKTEKVNS